MVDVPTRRVLRGQSVLGWWRMPTPSRTTGWTSTALQPASTSPCQQRCSASDAVRFLQQVGGTGPLQHRWPQDLVVMLPRRGPWQVRARDMDGPSCTRLLVRC